MFNLLLPKFLFFLENRYILNIINEIYKSNKIFTIFLASWNKYWLSNFIHIGIGQGKWIWMFKSVWELTTIPIKLSLFENQSIYFFF